MPQTQENQDQFFAFAAGSFWPQPRVSETWSRGKNSRLGSSSLKTASHLGFAVCNSTTALGLRAGWVENRGGAYRCARYYDPTIGRFISEDPIGFIGGGNFYRYSLNDPINLRDPMGLNPGTIAIPIEECFASGVCPTVIAGCFASGVCETVIIVGAGTAAVGAVGYYGYNYFSKRNKQSDPIARPADTTPGSCKNGGGKCNPCPPDTGYWEQAGNAHGSTTGSHFHWYTWDQAPYPDCTCRPHRQSGPTAPPGVNPL